MLNFKDKRSWQVKFVIFNVIILLVAALTKAAEVKKKTKSTSAGTFKYTPSESNPFVPLQESGIPTVGKIEKESWRLSSILYNEKDMAGSLAIINNFIVKVGDKVKGRKITVKVKEIGRDFVVLQYSEKLKKIFINPKKSQLGRRLNR
jgi:hypothetical protein